MVTFAPELINVKLLSRIANLFMAVAIPLALAATAMVTLGPLAFHYRPYVVLSGSMEPAIRTGSIILAMPTDPNSLKVGDVVTFQRSDVNESVTHRIIERKDDATIPTFVTKGDANSAPDSFTVSYAPGNQAGKVFLSVPYIGYAYAILGSPQGRAAFIIIPVLVLTLMYLWQIWRPQIKLERRDVEIPKPIAPEPEPAPGPLASSTAEMVPEHPDSTPSPLPLRN